MTLINKDNRYIWHPFTQQATAKEAIIIDSAKESYLYDINNNAYLDLISSWWTNIHGHGHPRLVAAIAKQAAKLDHVMFARFSHQPAIELAERLIALLPHYNRVFYTDNGSTAIEAAIKIALQYWYNQGQQKSTLIAFQGGYHGDTFGAMATGASSGFYTPFQPLLFDVIFNDYPHTWNGDKDRESKEQHALSQLETTLKRHHQTVAALIMEPLVQGASGMRMVTPHFVNQVVTLCHTYNVLVIFDEVMTGFGRTGTLFASNQLQHSADIICLSKGITGGILPLAVTLVTEQIYAAFLDESFEKAFSHGHSYTANPISCAAALENLDIFRDENTLAHIQRIHAAHLTYTQELAHHPLVSQVRVTGTIAAFNVVSEHKAYGSSLGEWIKEQSLQRGLNIRPLGNIIYLLPPYCTTDKQIKAAYNGIKEILLLLEK